MRDEPAVAEGSPPLRIATWNLERPRRTSVRRVPYQLARINEFDADIWVLTETSDAIDLRATTRSSIDHITLDEQSLAQVRDIGAWEAGRGDGCRLSDHNGVWVDLIV